MKYDISIQTETGPWSDITKVHDHHTQRTYAIRSPMQLRMFLIELERKYDYLEIEHESGDYEYRPAAPCRLKIFG